MTRSDIVDAVSIGSKLTKIEVKAIVDGVFSTIIESLTQGKRIEIRGFGVYKTKSRKARMARNPKTGEPVQLVARFTPVFVPSVQFRDKLNEVKAPEPVVESVAVAESEVVVENIMPMDFVEAVPSSLQEVKPTDTLF
ncbi:MAG: integration host factor subunit beta [Candidatus Kapabacteria bacterium]|nr:integration host factor subunit beta [Candidatus Kapabacteria bacterium]